MTSIASIRQISFVSVTVLICSLALSVPQALAWNGKEHKYIGTEGFHQACVRLYGSYADDPTRSQRYDIVCDVLPGNVTSSLYKGAFTYDSLMGERSRLAADHTDNPQQLTSLKLQDMVVDVGVFARIAVTNYRHFQPASAISWRDEHARALQAAVVASNLTGLDAIRHLETAFAIEAFAQHYLQDSFAAGHIGFNRVASSNAAALTYHEAKNRLGRCVADQQGEVWYTYGDDHFEATRFDTGEAYAARVIGASTDSFRDVIAVYVTGDVAFARAEEIWSRIPAYVKSSAQSVSACAAGGNWESLRTIQRPARSVSTIEFATFVDKSIYRPAPKGLMIGISRDYAFTFPIGDRVVQNRLFVGVGVTTSEIGRRSYLARYDYLWHVGTSARGTITHEIGAGQQFFYLPSSDRYYAYRNWSSHLLYAANIEVGRVFVRLLAGPGVSKSGSGVHAGVGVGYVRKAKH